MVDETSIRIAVEGCGHGTLHAIYASVEESCKRKGWPGVDLLIIGGDFQSVRNAYDLNCVSMPAKYREMCDFHEYYSGQRVAPYLTIFVGGNHEASNYLFELYYGGWVAPNIYYMGAANVLRLGPLRIAGMSGIWKGFDYRKPHHERLPYTEGDIKSIYHIRELDVRKLLQIRTQVDVGISHDWPQGVEWLGNFKWLFSKKKDFEQDARSGRLGSVAAKNVLDWLRPKHWFSAHLHIKYAAVVRHEGSHNELHETTASAKPVAAKNGDEIDLDIMDDDDPAPQQAVMNTDEIDLDMDDDTDVAGPENKAGGASREQNDPLTSARAALPEAFQRRPAPEPAERPEAIKNTVTNFLSLDKCLANRDFLQLLSIEVDAGADLARPLKLGYDREWLAITRGFTLEEPPVFGDPDARVPAAKSQTEYNNLIDRQLTWVDANLKDLSVPENFEVVAPVYEGGDFRALPYQQGKGEMKEHPNPQTAAFCNLLQMPNPLEVSDEELSSRMAAGPRHEESSGFRGGRSHRGGGRRRGGMGDRGGRWRGRGR